MRQLLTCGALLVLIPGATAWAQWNDPGVRRAFEEADALAAVDGGALWGRSLAGPMIVVNRATREVMASQADGEGLLAEADGVFLGKLPDDVNAANTATRWAGVHWTMLMAPLPEKETDRGRLLLHELFHRVQDDLGLPASSPANAHLDGFDGRLWFRLEIQALVAALDAEEDERTLCAEDALTFRACRRSLCEKAEQEEDALEVNEGICEYTGLRLCGLDGEAQRVHAMARLRGEDRSDTMTRSFAYATGPAYGLLLDGLAPDWRTRVAEAASLSDLLAEALGYLAPDELLEEAELLMEEYDGSRLHAEESRRREQRERRRAEHLARYFEEPVLILPLSPNMRYSFNPYQIEVLDGVGQVHATLRVTDDWGVLEVDGGALLVRRDGKMVEVRLPAAPDADARPVRGPGWTLALNEGFEVEAGERPGDQVVRRGQR